MGCCASVQQPPEVDHPSRPVRAPIHVKAAAQQQQQQQQHTRTDGGDEDEDEEEEAQPRAAQRGSTKTDGTAGCKPAAAKAVPLVPAEVTCTAAGTADSSSSAADDLLSPNASPPAAAAAAAAAIVVAAAPAAPRAPVSFGTEPLPPAAFFALLPSAALKARSAQSLPAGSKAARMWDEILRVGPVSYARDHPQRWADLLLTHEHGVPSQHRAALWARGLRVHEVSFPSSYAALLAQPCACDDQISRDIRRTFSDQPFFAEAGVQRALGRILRATSLCTPRIGYVQGINYMAAMMLWVSLDEEGSWRMLVAMLAHPTRGTQRLYAEGLAALIAQCRHLDSTLLPLYSPALAAHLQAKGVEALMYATPLFLTLFTHHLPLEACKTVWDFCILARVADDHHDDHDHEQGGGDGGEQQQPQHGEEEKQVAGGGSSPASAPSAAGRSNAVSPLPSAPPALSLLPCPLVHSASLLTLSLLDVCAPALRRLTSMEKLFHSIQRLEVLAAHKTRRKVFQQAMHWEQQRRKLSANANAAAAAAKQTKH